MVSFEEANIDLNICVLMDLMCHYLFYGSMAFVLNPSPFWKRSRIKKKKKKQGSVFLLL